MGYPWAVEGDRKPNAFRELRPRLHSSSRPKGHPEAAGGWAGSRAPARLTRCLTVSGASRLGPDSVFERQWPCSRFLRGAPGCLRGGEPCVLVLLAPRAREAQPLPRLPRLSEQHDRWSVGLRGVCPLSGHQRLPAELHGSSFCWQKNAPDRGAHWCPPGRGGGLSSRPRYLCSSGGEGGRHQCAGSRR